MGLRIQQRMTKKARMITTLVALFALVAQPMYGLVAAQVANALGGATTTVRSGSLQGWTKYGTATPEFWGVSSPLGQGALKMSTPNGSQYIQLDREMTPVSAHNFNLSYDTKRLAGVAHAAPSYILAIDKNGEGTGGYFWAWYEPVYNNTEGKDYSAWNTWSLNSSAKYWYNGDKPAEAVAYTQTLDSVLVNLPNAKVVGATINMGSGNAGWSALVDNVKTTDSTYDFEPTLPTGTVDTPRMSGIVAVDKRGGILPITGKFTDDIAPNRLQFQLVYKGKSVALGIVYGSQVGADGKYSYNMPVPTGLESGEYSLFYTATDFQNGIGPRLERKILIDNTAPTGTISTPVVGSIVGVANGKLSVTGTVTENIAMNRIGVQLVKKGVSGQVQNILANDNQLYGTNPTTWSAEFKNLSLQDSGEYGINLTLVDQDGNVTKNPTHWFKVDAVAPTTSIAVSSATGTGSLHRSAVRVTGVVDPSELNIKSHWFEITNPDSSLSYSYKMTSSDLTYGFDLDTSKGSGEYKLRYVAADKFGNKSDIVSPTIRTIEVDDDVPVVTTSIVNLSTVAGSNVVLDMTTANEANPKVVNIRVLDSNGILAKDKNGNDITGLYKPNYTLNAASYTWDTTKMNDGVYKIQFSAKDAAGNPATPVYRTVTVHNTQPDSVLSAENFNTHSGTDYEGLNVGFNIDNFQTVSHVSVALYRDGATLPFVTNTQNANLLGLINGGGVEALSTPFIIQPGTYTEEYWTLGDYTWVAGDSAPARALVTVTGVDLNGNAVSKEVTLMMLANQVTTPFASLLPAAAPVVPSNPTTPSFETPNIINRGTPVANPASLFAGNAFAVTQPTAAQTVADAAVLGAQDVKDDTGILGASNDVAAITPSADGWKIFGFAWYLWALLIAAVAAIWWWIAAARRRSQDA